MENPDRVTVQKLLMADLHRRAAPFLSKKEKVQYCDNFYKSVRRDDLSGRVPIHISSAVRHFFHNNIQIGDVPKWARLDATLIKRFIEVLKIYGPDKAKVKARRATLENPRKILVIPPEERENFVHLLDGIEISEEDEADLRRGRREKFSPVRPVQTPKMEQRQTEDERQRQMKQMYNLLAGSLLMNQQMKTMQLLLQTAGMGLPVLTVLQQFQSLGGMPTVPSSATLSSPDLSAALCTPSPPLVRSPETDQENLPPKTESRHSHLMEGILEKIKATMTAKI